MSDKKVLVYQYQAGSHSVLMKNPEVITQKELSDILHKNSHLQQSSKPIYRTDVSIEIKQQNLLTEEQKNSANFNTKPNYDANVASVELPKDAIFKNIVYGAYSELIILSEKRKDKY